MQEATVKVAVIVGGRGRGFPQKMLERWGATRFIGGKQQDGQRAFASAGSRCLLLSRPPVVFISGLCWIGLTMKLSGSDLQPLLMYSQGMRTSQDPPSVREPWRATRSCGDSS